MRLVFLLLFLCELISSDCDSCGSYGRCLEYSTTNSTLCTTCACPSEIGTTCCEDPTPCSSNNCTANEECVVNGALSYDCYFKYGYNSTNCTDGNNELVCQNNGNCTTSSNGTVCVCEIGFTGDTCQTELGCASYPCQNGGSCQNVNETNYECTCLSLYNGTTCSYYDPCNASPCKHGECLNPSNGEFECNCTTGYNGTLCETIINYCDDTPCMYNGTCSSYIGYYECSCLKGSSGTNCQTLVDNCGADSSNVTVCNVNDTSATCTNMFNDYNCSCTGDWRGKNCSIPLIVWEALQYFDDQSDNVAQFLINISPSPEDIQLAASYVVAATDLANLTDAGWTLAESILGATFELRQINISEDFVISTDSTLGNCFTFNDPKSNYIYNLRNSGEQNGLSMVMKVNEQEYLPWVDIAMMSIYVHDYNSLVFSESLSFDSIPGAVAVLKIAKSTYTRLGGHYGKCAEKRSEVAAYYYSGNYSTDACLWSCYQVQVNNSCNCMDPRFNIPRGHTACGMSDAVCVFNVTEMLGDPSTWDTCDCPTECNSVQFDTQWDSADFPEYPAECANVSGNATAYSACRTMISDYARVIIYFPDITQTTFAEASQWSLNSILAYFGGLVGAVMGFSFVAIIEVAFLVYRCLLVMCTNESATLDEVEIGTGDDDDNPDEGPKLLPSLVTDDGKPPDNKDTVATNMPPLNGAAPAETASLPPGVNQMAPDLLTPAATSTVPATTPASSPPSVPAAPTAPSPAPEVPPIAEPVVAPNPSIIPESTTPSNPPPQTK